MSRIHYKNYRGIARIAGNLRKNCTPSEILLWHFLRKRSILGFKFLRQHPIFYRIDKEWVEFYIADFYCAEIKLIIEIDGPIHLDKKDYDSERDIKLTNKGIKVLRIKNEELENINQVIYNIKENIKLRVTENQEIQTDSLPHPLLFKRAER